MRKVVFETMADYGGFDCAAGSYIHQREGVTDLSESVEVNVLCKEG
jgi:hypothetical protein